MSRSKAIEFREITKTFGNLVANDKVSFAVEPGSIHAVVGENGAGKSTLMKILAGLYAPDCGQIFLDGQEVRWSDPESASQNGIGMVHQHFMLADSTSHLDNVILGVEPILPICRTFPKFLQIIDRKSALEKLSALQTENSFSGDLGKKVADTPLGIQQQSEILKVLFRNSQYLILDEPTAVLTPQEIDRLFETLKSLKEKGRTIIIITHKLKEVMGLCDRVTVMRAGKVVLTNDVNEINIENLAEAMIGKRLQQNALKPRPAGRNKSLLTLKDLTTCDGKLSNINLDVKEGEIIGIAGVEGNGQAEIARFLSGPADYEVAWSGAVTILDRKGETLNRQTTRAQGIGILPYDRIRDGILGPLNLFDNFLLGQVREPQSSKWGWILKNRVMNLLESCLRKFDVRPPKWEQSIQSFSGGNQQKFVFAREAYDDLKLIIASQPTRGVDIGATHFIHSQLLEARERGTGVVLISSDLDEILKISDRIIVFFKGKIAGEFQRQSGNERDIGLAMAGEAR